VVWWGSASTSCLNVIDTMLAREPRIPMIRASADCYPDAVVHSHFRGAEMRVVEGEIAAEQSA
jgi:hypothetical protein